jgi:SPX domain protein involved in polyphosphate accumulation
VNSTPTQAARPPLLKRVLSVANGADSSKTSAREEDVALEAYREFDFRKAEFFHFLDGELEKIESFYKEKEDEAKERLEALRQQLHILRQLRLHDIESADRRKKAHQVSNGDARHPRSEAREETDGRDERSQSRLPVVEHLHRYKNSVASQVDDAIDKVRTGHVGKTAKAMRDLGTPVAFARDAHSQDYTRRPQQAVTYRAGKRKLKRAFVEYYRSLELLKSYTLLNHTAFRKITKKCDKTMPGHSGADYFRDKVNKAYFVSSNVLDYLVL